MARDIKHTGCPKKIPHGNQKKYYGGNIYTFSSGEEGFTLWVKTPAPPAVTTTRSDVTLFERGQWTFLFLSGTFLGHPISLELKLV